MWHEFFWEHLQQLLSFLLPLTFRTRPTPKLISPFFCSFCHLRRTRKDSVSAFVTKEAMAPPPPLFAPSCSSIPPPGFEKSVRAFEIRRERAESKGSIMWTAAAWIPSLFSGGYKWGEPMALDVQWQNPSIASSLPPQKLHLHPPSIRNCRAATRLVVINRTLCFAPSQLILLSPAPILPLFLMAELRRRYF